MMTSPQNSCGCWYSAAFSLAVIQLMVSLVSEGTIGADGARPSPKKQDEHPHFDIYRVENHTVQLGATAFLPCVIRNLGNKSVSWIRARDSHILTVDSEVFISDLRFSAMHSKHESAWMLQIKSVEASDAGKYECQVSTTPKLSHFVYLTVIVPKVRIFGDKDIYVKDLSTVQLKCVVSQSLVAPTYIEWRHNNKRIQTLPETASGGSGGGGGLFSVLTGGGGNGGSRHRRLQTTPPEHIAEGTTMSTLTILHAEKTDTGNYTCHPTQLEVASVMLHVLESDLPALMQTSRSPVLSSEETHVWLATVLSLLALKSILLATTTTPNAAATRS